MKGAPRLSAEQPLMLSDLMRQASKEFERQWNLVRLDEGGERVRLRDELVLAKVASGWEK